MKYFLLLLFVIAIAHARIISPNDTSISFFGGRVDKSHLPQYISFDWSSVNVIFQFQATSRDEINLPLISLADNGNQYNYYVVEESSGKNIAGGKFATQTDGGNIFRQYTIGNFTPSSTSSSYRLIVEKRTEALFGVVKFGGFVLNQNIYLSTSKRQRKPSVGPKILFIGDSITCAYGNEGKYPCRFDSTTENVHMSYASQAARLLESPEYQITCWSGKGMVRNYGDPKQLSVDPFPVYFPRSVANQPNSTYDFTQFVPDIISVALGSNDFSTAPQPSFEQYSSGYNKFLDTLFSIYKPLRSNIQVAALDFPGYQDFIKNVVLQRGDPNVHYISMVGLNDHQGCDYHPSVASDTKMAQVLSDALRQIYKNL